MKTVLICLDLDQYTDQLIEKALDLVSSFAVKIWLLHVAAPDPDFVGYDVGPQYIRDNRAETLREEHRELLGYMEKIKKTGIDAEALLVQGPTIETILEESIKLEVDLIVTGYQEHGFFYSVFNNNVSSKVIATSDIPVLVIPAGK